MRAFFLSCIFLLLANTSGAVAALQFPALTGHVVDDAHILSAHSTQALEQALSDYENGTTNQVVVVTLPTLQGTSIEDYGYQLGRHWGIGQKGKDNGALLIVVPSEHKVRIEVGYGLEGTLTDAASNQIIQTVILPAFRAGEIERGTTEGAQAIVNVLGGKSIPSPDQQTNNLPKLSIQQMLMIIGVVIFVIWFSIRHPLIARALFDILWLFANVSSRSGSSGVDSGWSGGGGGSFGGGGASGSW